VYSEIKNTGACGIFQLLGSMVTNDARCTREIKSRITTANAFKKKKEKKEKEMKKEEEAAAAVFTSKLDLNLRKKPVVLHLECGFVWCCNLDTWESRSQVPGKL
jgi:hypothetical protein